MRRRSFGAWRRGRLAGGVATLALFALVLGAIYLLGPEPPLDPGGRPLVGHAGHVVDGDTLDLEGQRVRLLGLDAPESAQSCEDGAGKQWQCGSAATARLRELVRGQELACASSGHDRYGRLLATCKAGNVDLAARMVAEGLAVTSTYLAEQQRAQAAHLGVWQGPFVTPSVWRQSEGRALPAPGGNPSRFDRFLAWLAGVFTN